MKRNILIIIITLMILNVSNYNISASTVNDGTYDDILLEVAQQIEFEKKDDNLIVVGADFIHTSDKNEYTVYWVLKPSTYQYFEENSQELKDKIYESMEGTLLAYMCATNGTKIIYNISSNKSYFEITFSVKELKELTKDKE